MSKSGLYAHFGSKGELQLATVAAAEEVFDADVVEPAMRADDGLDRVEALCERFLSHIERPSSPAAASSRPSRPSSTPGQPRCATGPRSSLAGRSLSLRPCAAQGQRELYPDASIEQLTFEINAILAQANTVFLLYGDRKVFDLARRSIRDRLERATAAAAAA